MQSSHLPPTPADWPPALVGFILLYFAPAMITVPIVLVAAALRWQQAPGLAALEPVIRCATEPWLCLWYAPVGLIAAARLARHLARVAAGREAGQ
jgi:hypothetical protein